MFDDFQAPANKKEARKRFGGSIALAVALYGTVGGLIVAGTATARKVAEEELTQVEFAPAPEPEPPPPPPEPVPAAVAAMRPKANRPKMAPPKEVPLEKPAESDKPLVEAGPPGPVEGSLDGVEGGKGTGRVGAAQPSPPKRTNTPFTAPVPDRNNVAPGYTPKLRRAGVEGVVVVTFEVSETGTVVGPRIVSGPAEFHELVLKTVSQWRFRPAMRDGKPLRFRKTQAIRFRLEDA
jgi:protein TonB